MLSLVELTEKADAMRQAPTLSESRAQDSFPPRMHVERQVIFGFYILDFVVPSKLLVIEIDGDTHAERRAHDAKRDAFCIEHGLRVLRVPNQLANQAGPLAAGYPTVEGWTKQWAQAQRAAGHRQTFVEAKRAIPTEERRAVVARNKEDRAARRLAAIKAVQAGDTPPWEVSEAEMAPLPVVKPARGSFMNQPKRSDTPEQRAERRAIKKQRRAAKKVDHMAERIAALAATTEW